MKKNILLVSGGNNTEHEVSLRSSDFLKKSMAGLDDLIVEEVVIGKDNIPRYKNDNKETSYHEMLEGINFVVPCIHGRPGETGEFQALLEIMNIPYLGCGPEASIMCFNKVTSKLWYEKAHIKNAPFTFLKDMDDFHKAEEFFASHKDIFVKASSQGSSVGSYPVSCGKDLKVSIENAFKHSPWVLLEKKIEGRELEVAVYEYEGKIVATDPGEISCPGGFYSYEEKYNNNSKTETFVQAEGVSEIKKSELKAIAKKAFKLFKLRHLSRVDFFLTNDNEVVLNEINTFPGMTSISMFPVLLEANGDSFEKFVYDIIKKECQTRKTK